MKKRYVIFLLAALIAFTGCPKKKKNAMTEGAPGAGAPAGQGAGSPAAGSDQSSAPDTKISPPENQTAAKSGDESGTGTLSGRVNFTDRQGRNGNLFIYVIDEANFDPVNPKPVASQIFTADRITEDSLEFDLGEVPAGEYNIIAVWDVNDPRCDATATFCAMGDRDVGAQAPRVTVTPGAEIKNIEINVVPVDY